MSGARDKKDLPDRPSLDIPVNQLLTIVENMSEGAFIVDMDKTITYLNPAGEKITGFSLEEAVGQKCFDIFRSSICENACPLDEGIEDRGISFKTRVSIIDKSGMEKTVKINTIPIKNKKGEIVGGVRIFHDISEFERFKRGLNKKFHIDDIVGKSPRMREILSYLPDIAESDSAVLIEGPTGSGKELIARAIHYMSPRKDGPFVIVNCAALPETLLESELFGYVRGAFTGALRNKPGRFSLANNGTLFLDEIASTAQSFQADLLRVIEDGEFTPLGGTESQRADFRLITATNLDLKKMVQEGRFRDDLYYRLNVIRITLPPLKDRREDIPLLIEHFIQKFNLLKGKNIEGVSSEAMRIFLDYDFPGNIRELENMIEYAFVMCKGRLIMPEHLPKDLLNASSNTLVELSGREKKEADKIKAILEKFPRGREQAAKALGISRTTLWRKMKRYGIR